MLNIFSNSNTSEGISVRAKPVPSLRTGLFLCCLWLVACGGGGGSSSGGGDGSDSSTGVRVLHAVIDGSPVDVLSSAQPEAIVSKVFFADNRGYRSLPGGAQTLRLTRALDQDSVVTSVNLTSSGDDSYSILYYGSVSGSGVRAKLLEDSASRGAAGTLIRFVHGAEGASTLLVSASGSSGAQQVSFGGASEYLEVAPGSVRLTATRGADGLAVVTMNETLQGGGVYTVLVAGEVGYYTKGVLFRDR